VPLGEQPDGAVPVLARAGDALFFDRRIWHASSTNLTDADRRILYYGYSHRWLRTKSAMDLPASVAGADPVRRQLLGWATSANGHFEPTPADVPLRTWIEQHVGPEAVAP
jgi:ectoine hydroxylase